MRPVVLARGGVPLVAACVVAAKLELRAIAATAANEILKVRIVFLRSNVRAATTLSVGSSSGF